MNPEELEELLHELLRGIQDVLQSGEVLSDEFQGVLAQTLNAMTQRIDELRSQEPQEPIPEEPTPETQGLIPTSPTGEGQQPTGGEVPELDRAPHESSNINAFKYFPDKKQLYIKFMGKDSADSGPVYSYQDIPKNIFDIIYRGGVAPITSGRNRYHEWHEGITPSHGAAVSALIKKGGYSYQRIS